MFIEESVNNFLCLEMLSDNCLMIHYRGYVKGSNLLLGDGQSFS